MVAGLSTYFQSIEIYGSIVSIYGNRALTSVWMDSDTPDDGFQPDQRSAHPASPAMVVAPLLTEWVRRGAVSAESG
jgi:hypothetical protein